MRHHRLSRTAACLLLVISACTDTTPDDVGDEVATESTSTQSDSTSETESSESTDTGGPTDTTEESTSEESTSEESTSEESTSEESTSEESTSEESTSEESTSDTGWSSCQEIEATYASLVESNTACDADAQCHVVDGHCDSGLGGCWHVVNENVQQSDLDDLLDAFQGMACPPLVICACLPPPAVAGCFDGTCQPF
jgi:hypothetical protein